jgi:hypothetical protein
MGKLLQAAYSCCGGCAVDICNGFGGSYDDCRSQGASGQGQVNTGTRD